VLDLLDLGKYSTRRAGSLSGGNKRKLSVGIALIGRPKVLLLDEPSTGMDPVAKRSMWALISKIRATYKISVVLSTHSMEEAEFLSDVIGIMHGGVFVAQGTLNELKSEHGRQYELSFMLANKGDAKEEAHRIQEALKAAGLKVHLLEAVSKMVKFVADEVKLDILFQKLEEIKAKCEIAEYNVLQTSLEQIFNKLAQQ
jgi:ABC-type multidrug transport system ATPase subunit